MNIGGNIGFVLKLREQFRIRLKQVRCQSSARDTETCYFRLLLSRFLPRILADSARRTFGL